MLHSLLAFLIDAQVIPRARSPRPEEIGPGVPFTAAGCLGVLAGFVKGSAPGAERDRTISLWSKLGFCGGMLVYSVLLLAQLLSETT